MTDNALTTKSTLPDPNSPPSVVSVGGVAQPAASGAHVSNDPASVAERQRIRDARAADMDKAQAALDADNIGEWIGTLNWARKTAGLAPLNDPGTPSARIDLMYRERQYWKEPGMKRVKVLQGFQHTAPEGEAKPIHLPGAVIDLSTDDARIEFERNRVQYVADDEPLREGNPSSVVDALAAKRQEQATKDAQAEADKQGTEAQSTAPAVPPYHSYMSPESDVTTPQTTSTPPATDYTGDER